MCGWSISPLFLCFSFWFKPSVRSACNSISQSLRDCVSQTTSEWMRSSSVPCVWQWIFFEECHMATALRNTGTWSQFVAWWGESHDMTAILRELGVGWYLGQIAKCRNDCQKGGVVDHQSRGGGWSWVSSIQQGSSHAFTMFPLIRKCNEVITQESSRCNWKEIGKAVLVNGCLGGGPCCCGWPVAPELLIKTWRLRSKEEDVLFLHPCNALITSTDLWTHWTGQRRQNWLACTNQAWVFIRTVTERTRYLKGSCCRALA